MALAIGITGIARGEDFSISYEPPTGIVAVGQPARVTLRGATTQSVRYRVKENGTRVTAEGELPADATVRPRPANFAHHVAVRTLIGMGLRDATSPAAGVFGMYNTLGGEKEIVIMPDAVHQYAQPKYDARQAVWLKEQRDRTSGPSGPATRPVKP